MKTLKTFGRLLITSSYKTSRASLSQLDPRVGGRFVTATTGGFMNMKLAGISSLGPLRTLASNAASSSPGAVNPSSSTATNAQTVPNRVEKTINQITLLGRVGADPQKRGSQEHPVVVFSLATHANYQYGTGDLLQKTDWHRVCVFKPYLRDTVYKYMNKGQRVLVQGRVTYGEVKNEDGSTHITASVIADDVTFFSKSPNEPASSDSQST